MARLRGQVDAIEAVPRALPLPLPEKAQKTVDFMRQSGALQEDIDAFVESQTA